MKKREFFERNLNKYHIMGMVSGIILSIIYWAKAGRFTDNVLKSSPILMILWGLLVGYILFEMIFNAKNRKENDENR